MEMNYCPGVARQGGGQAGRGGSEKCVGGYGTNKPKPVKKASFKSDTETIKNNIFECRRPEGAAAFKKSLTRVADYIHQEGEKEANLIAEAIETFIIPTIQMPPMPPMMADTANLGTMIKD